MTLGTKIVIDKIAYGGEFKKYRSTQEQIQQNEREKLVQRERDQRVQNQANNCSEESTRQPTR